MIRPVQKLMRELVHKKARFFLAASLAALGLRLLLVVRFPGIVDDSRLYANIAENSGRRTASTALRIRG